MLSVIKTLKQLHLSNELVRLNLFREGKPMTLSELLAQLTQRPVSFQTVMQVIEDTYIFIPTLFTNGDLTNPANTNNGSCRIFAFGLINKLSEQATLNAFGDYYTQDVLQNPEGTDHQNIRQFIKTGWKGISFSSPALIKKY